MGHSDISTTMDVYAEATKEKKKEAFDNLEGKIKICWYNNSYCNHAIKIKKDMIHYNWT